MEPMDTFATAGDELLDDEPLIVQRAIRDGSQCLQHDGYDVQTFAEALETFGQLRKAVDGARKRLVTAPALFRDLFWSFHKPAQHATDYAADLRL